MSKIKFENLSHTELMQILQDREKRLADLAEQIIRIGNMANAHFENAERASVENVVEHESERYAFLREQRRCQQMNQGHAFRYVHDELCKILDIDPAGLSEQDVIASLCRWIIRSDGSESQHDTT